MTTQAAEDDTGRRLTRGRRSRHGVGANRRGRGGLDAGSARIDAEVEVSTRGRHGSTQRWRSRRRVGTDQREGLEAENEERAPAMRHTPMTAVPDPWSAMARV
jgi:hypothetical protein